MALFRDRVLETTTTTGTGTISFAGAKQGYRAFSAAFTTGDVIFYTIALGADWEVGVGTLTTGTPWTLSRTTVLASSNANALVSFPAGTKDVFSCVPTDGLVNAAHGTVTMTNLTASTALALDGSKQIVSVANTGTGSNVLSNSPTLSAPVLGTPTSGNLANCTFPTLNQSTTGNATTATTATHIAGGGAGTIHYNSAAGTTAQLAAGTSGYLLASGGAAAPVWTAASTLSVLYAATAGAAPASDVYAWAKAATKPTYTYTEVGAQVAGSYEAPLTFSGGVSRAVNAISITYGTTASTVCQGNDSRLSDARVASDVYAWAKAASKPTYTYSEVGAIAAGGAAGSVSGVTLQAGLGTGNSPSFVDVTITSDERFKTNWRPLGVGIFEKFVGVKYGIYDRVDADVTQVGVSAQSLQRVLPEAIHTDEDGYLHISQSATLAIVAEMAQELLRLRARVATLEAK
jgi:hypothetical protein